MSLSATSPARIGPMRPSGSPFAASSRKLGRSASFIGRSSGSPLSAHSMAANTAIVPATAVMPNQITMRRTTRPMDRDHEPPRDLARMTGVLWGVPWGVPSWRRRAAASDLCSRAAANFRRMCVARAARRLPSSATSPPRAVRNSRPATAVRLPCGVRSCAAPTVGEAQSISRSILSGVSDIAWNRPAAWSERARGSSTLDNVLIRIWLQSRHSERARLGRRTSLTANRWPPSQQVREHASPEHARVRAAHVRRRCASRFTI